MKRMLLNVEQFLVCSTGEEVEVPEPQDSLEAAIKLRDEKQAAEENGEDWGICAVLVDPSNDSAPNWIAKIFNEWQRRYLKDPEEFLQNLSCRRGAEGEVLDDYGYRCEDYFNEIAKDLGLIVQVASITDTPEEDHHV